MPTLEDEILIGCSRLHLDDVHRDRVVRACAQARVNWELVYAAAVAHKVAPLVYKNLKSCGSIDDLLPATARDEFEKASRWCALKNAIVRKGIADLAAFFESRSHDVLLLKHAAFAVRLPELHDSTVSDDVDGVVRPQGESVNPFDERYLWKLRPWMFSDKLQRLFRRFTYDDADHTSALIREFGAHDLPWRSLAGLELENRIHHDVVWSGVIAIDFRMIWRDANQDQLEGRPVYVPNVCDLLIMSAASVGRKPFLRLRNLVEIDELGRSLKDRDWDLLVSKARAYRCDRLVYSALQATKAILESDIPEPSLLALKPSVLRRQAVGFVNRHISPSAVCRSRNPRAHLQAPRGDLRELARRLIALDTRQLTRFVWYRIALRKILRVIKW
jgi:hypothetical protein